MQDHPSALRRLWRRLLGHTPATPAPAAPRLTRLDGAAAPQPLRAREERRVGIEPLEGRIAPAALTGAGQDFSYTDPHGDTVAVHFSKAIFGAETGAALQADLDKVFIFSGPQLQKINLVAAPTDAHGHNQADGVSLSLSVAAAGATVDVGAIEATGLTLGAVSIQGDLGHINVGNFTVATGLQSLTVGSLGVRTDTQIDTPASGTTPAQVPSYTSTVTGGLGSFTAGVVEGAFLHAQSGGAAVPGNIGTLTIAHHLTAKSAATAAIHDGQIRADGSIGAILVGTANAAGDDALTGGAGLDAGTIGAGAGIGSITVTGNLHGGIGIESGAITATGKIGGVTIHGALLGSGLNSGSIHAGTSLGPATIGTGSGIAIQGGDGVRSGNLLSDGSMGTVHLLGDLVGGAGVRSGNVFAKGALAGVVIDGSIKGGTGTSTVATDYSYSGIVGGQASIGSVTVASDIVGGMGDHSGFIGSNAIGSLIVKGRLVGGSAMLSGSVFAGLNALGQAGTDMAKGIIGSVAIGSSHLMTDNTLIGGAGNDSGTILAGGSIGPVAITGNLHGGAGTDSASISATAKIGAVVVHGQLIGDGQSSATIFAGTALGSVTVGTGTGAAVAGGDNQSSGAILSNGSMGPVHLLGNLLGSEGPSSGTISAKGTLAGVTIDGSVLGGTGAATATGAYGSSGSIAGVAIGPITVSGDVIGGKGTGSGVLGGNSFSSVLIKGKLQGGAGAFSGAIAAGVSGITGIGQIHSVTVSHGIAGGSGESSGTITAFGSIGTATVGQIAGGTVAIGGGTGNGSGFIQADNNIGAVHLLGDVIGVGDESGGVFAAGSLGPVVVLGSLIGEGTSLHSGNIEAGGSLSSVIIHGNVEGGGDHSGSIVSGGTLNSVLVTGHLKGGTGSYSGVVVGGYTGLGNLRSVEIQGGLIGGSGSNSGAISAGANLGTVLISEPSGGTSAIAGGGGAYSGSITAEGSIGSVSLHGGALTGSTGAHSGAIEADGFIRLLQLGAVHGGSVHAGSIGVLQASALDTATIAAVDSIALLTVGGDVGASTILAGYDVTGAPVNGHATIGSVVVGGAWHASNLVAGVLDAARDGFGNTDTLGHTDDTGIPISSHAGVATIGRIAIAGTVTGDGTSQAYGFEATRIGAFSAHGVALPLTAAGGQSFTVAGATVREIAAATPV